jgi:hypothetical protein
MTTQITTHHPVRSDLPGAAAGRRTPPSRRWAVAGVGAGLAGIGTIVTSSMVGAVYDQDLHGDPVLIQEALADQQVPMFVFHSVTALGAVLLLVFAAGLFGRLRDAAGETAAPLVALLGLAGTAVVSILGSGLDTEFMLDPGNSEMVAPSSVTMYNHWIGTIPWLWTLAGVAGLATYAVARRGGVPRWIGRTGLVLGGLTVLLGISPFEYMAGMTGVLLVLVTAVGFTVGDRAHRAA